MIFHQSMVKIIAGILAIIGLCVGVNVTFFQTRGFAETTAVITDLTEEGSGDDTTYRPTVEYEVDGETYNVKLDNSVKADSVGNTITVLYDPSNPELAYGKNVTEKTSAIAIANNAVLAINGDYYGAQESGYVLRNGVIYRNKAKKGKLDQRKERERHCIYRLTKKIRRYELPTTTSESLCSSPCSERFTSSSAMKYTPIT